MLDNVNGDRIIVGKGNRLGLGDATSAMMLLHPGHAAAATTRE